MILDENKTYECSMCGRTFTEEEAKKELLMTFPDSGVTVCNECAKRALAENVQQELDDGTYEGPVSEDGRPIHPVNEIRKEIQVSNAQKDYITYLKNVITSTSPSKIKAHLDEYVIGQEDAKKTLSVAVYNHYKRIMYQEELKLRKAQGKPIPKQFPTRMNKSNILLLGPSGVGKTHVLETLAEYLDVPFAVTDSSTLTESGYVGMDPDTCIKNLLTAAGGDVKKAEHGIVFLDEFDKIARKTGANLSTTSDPGHEGVQQALLKIIEGTTVNINLQTRRRNPDMPGIDVDTTNILFVCGGAFEGIDEIISDRVNQDNGFGFGEEQDALGLDDIENEADRYNTLIDHATVEDAKEYGIIPEMLGRLPIMCKLHQLKEADLIRILTEPKDAIIKQYKELFVLDGCAIDFEQDALDAIAKKAIETKTGARSLRTIIEGLLLDTMYDLPDIADKAKENNTIPYIKVTKENIETKNFDIKYKAAA